MDTAAAATQAHVTPATIRTWCRHNVIAAIKTAGRWIIDTASLAARIAIGAMRARKQAPMALDLTATYTADLPGGGPVTITPTIKRRTRNGENLISVTGIVPLLAEKIDTITDLGDRLHAVTVLQRATIVITDLADTDWDDAPQARDSGQLRTTYSGDIPQVTIADVLDLAAQLRTQLAA
ncbi:helix-turn-helix domain-containing protein [Streptomyces sp. BA2]|uniref:helix-turn-helix domain-containing protein n=1 Tax=Streptomyces sp. BA2 TaxID=436595 RepID=UPI0013245B18|nr:helix-turn-helix domain-containing protein [Streptomyces sp. BA2]MWA08801.1 hypothetical protein [Streptomyces sp. BA2]